MMLLPAIAATGILSLTALPSATMDALAFHTFGGTYVVQIIPGAAQRDSLFHYYPPLIAVPSGTEVSWFQGDSEQPHTVTSGSPGDENPGMAFNSGVMPYQRFFTIEFNEPGDYPYFCIIHPWRFGVVHVSEELETGNNFEFSTGTGTRSWNQSEFDRNLLKFEPTTIALDESTPASYYLTIFNTGTGNTVYSSSFPSTNNLLVELIPGESNRTTTFGPDRASTVHSTPGAYHVQGNFGPGEYRISVAVTAVNGQPLERVSGDQFQFSIMSSNQSDIISSANTTISTTAGKQFNITLDSNQATGYEWEVASNSNPDAAKFVNSEYIPPDSDLLGAGGKQVFVFDALEEGSATIVLEYLRPWETGVQPAKTYTAEVTVGIGS
jgi:predicted secreted protein/plastocyanin